MKIQKYSAAKTRFVEVTGRPVRGLQKHVLRQSCRIYFKIMKYMQKIHFFDLEAGLSTVEMPIAMHDIYTKYTSFSLRCTKLDHQLT